jgi:hypothetical protein
MRPVEAAEDAVQAQTRSGSRSAAGFVPQSDAPMIVRVYRLVA